MRIHFICYEGFERPSARVRAYYFAEELRRLGCCAEVFSISDRFNLRGQQPYRLMDAKKLLYNFDILVELLRRPADLIVLQKICYHALAPLWLDSIRHTPIVVDLDDWDFAYQPFRTFRLAGTRAIERFNKSVLCRSALITVASKHIAIKACELTCGRIPVKRIPTGVDLAQGYQPTRWNPETPFVVTWIGQIWGDRIFECVSDLIKAIALIPNKYQVQLHLVGSYSSYELGLRRLINDLDVAGRVILRPWIAPNQVSQYLCETHCGIYTIRGVDDYNLSKSPTKVFEYMAAGRPTIATPIGEVTDIIIDGVTGLFARSISEMANSIIDLASQPNRARIMGEQARKEVETKYSLQRLVPKLLAFYRNVINDETHSSHRQ